MVRRGLAIAVTALTLGACGGPSTQERENAPPAPGENESPSPGAFDEGTETSGEPPRNVPRSGSGPNPQP